MGINQSVRGLPHGVRVQALLPHCDARGSFTKIYREDWDRSVVRSSSML